MARYDIIIASLDSIQGFKFELNLQQLNCDLNRHINEIKIIKNSMINNIEQEATAVPFIYLENERFVVSKEARLFLSELKNPVCVLTIVGKYRTGKSLFLNRIMLGRPKAFKVSPTINSCTRGLWLWKDTLKFSNEEQQKQVLIIDTQGFGATQQSDAYNNKILLFALLLSSYFVYNSVGSIDETSLNNISVLANLANEIQSKNSKDENIEQYFPSFLWLVRDFTLNLVDKNDCPIQAKEYLEQALQIQKGTSNLIEGKNKIRRMMRHFFSDRDCFTLVRPVETEEKLQRLDVLEEGEFREEFLQQSRSLRSKILNKIRPKRLKNTVLNGESLLQLAENYVEVVNGNSMPNFESSYRHLLRMEMGNMKKRVCVENQLKIRTFVDKVIGEVKSQQEYQTLKLQFVGGIESEVKERVKRHHSLGVFVNTQEIAQMVGEIRNMMGQMVERQFKEVRDGMRLKYRQIVDVLREDNMMGEKLGQIRSEKQFRQFTNGMCDRLAFEADRQRISPMFVREFQRQFFQPYIQGLQEEFVLSTRRRLQEENNQMKVKLQMKEQYVRQKEVQFERIQRELREERRENVELGVRTNMLEKEMALLKEELTSRDLNYRECVTRLEGENSTLKLQLITLSKDLDCMNNELTNTQTRLSQALTNVNILQKQLTLTKNRLQNSDQQLVEKRSIIEGFNKMLEEKSAKMETLLGKIQQLRESKEEIYQKYTYKSQQMSTKVVTLQKANTKLATQLKELTKTLQTIENDYNEKTRLFKEQLRKQTDKNDLLQQEKHRLYQTIKSLQQLWEKFIIKQQKYKQFKKCVKNSSSMQCLHCERFFMSSIFLTHLSVCTHFVEGQGVKQAQSTEEMAFNVKNVTLHENSGKPYTVYEVECVKGDKRWVIERRFTELCELNDNLSNMLPGVELSQARSIFDPKYLSKKSLTVEEKRFLIERYFNDLGKNRAVLGNKYWQQFVYEKSETTFMGISQPATRRTALGELNQQSSVGNSLLNYQMKRSQSKEDNNLVRNNNSVKKESLRTPEEFFRIWEQKQSRTKPSQVVLKKTMS